MMEIIKVEETTSTNRLAAELATSHEVPFAVSTRNQTHGRGQRGNSWESAPGENVTLSIVWHPRDIAASKQFIISQAVAVAVADMLKIMMPDRSGEIAVKWPNDIYVNDRKIAGILIENSLLGSHINRTIIGIGLNVNQTVFFSDAPNPVSMKLLTGKTYDVDICARTLCETVEKFFNAYLPAHRHGRLRGRYFSALWRASGYWPYIDVATGKRFDARISNIASSGHITLTEPPGERHTYAFKEVQPVI